MLSSFGVGGYRCQIRIANGNDLDRAGSRIGQWPVCVVLLFLAVRRNGLDLRNRGRIYTTARATLVDVDRNLLYAFYVADVAAV